MDNDQASPRYDEIDLTILTHLQEDATVTNVELAKRIGLSPSACLGRIRRLKEAGVIKRLTAILDEQKVGLEAVTFVFVTLSPHDRVTTETFLAHIHGLDNVQECYSISGKYDYLLKIISTSLAQYRNFVIDTLIEAPGVDKVETTVVLSNEKQTYQLPLLDSRLWQDRATEAQERRVIP